MKKFVKDVIITFFIMGIVCTVFYKIGWLRNWNEIFTMFFITALVIAIDLIKMIFSHKTRGKKSTDTKK